ncbi:hypothetical protein, partial [Bifidobacterium jacchi]|uniref:hypothetical protein n=1 Tax=Bifidobacterium jacchi TaxID=2490545 RepID=UPI0019D5DE6D
ATVCHATRFSVFLASRDSPTCHATTFCPVFTSRGTRISCEPASAWFEPLEFRHFVIMASDDGMPCLSRDAIFGVFGVA